MKKIIFIMSLSFISLVADNIISTKYPIINAYLKQYVGERNFNETQSLAQTQCFKGANEYIYNPIKQKTVIVDVGDLNILADTKKVKTKVANYTKALKELNNCVRIENNPLAAWEGIYIINSFIGINYKSNIKMYKRFANTLYKDQSCLGYLSQGDIYNKGIATPIDRKKALLIYKQGLNLCTDGWLNMVLKSRINNMKYEK